MQHRKRFGDIDCGFLKQVKVIRLVIFTGSSVGRERSQVAATDHKTPGHRVRIANGLQIQVPFQLIIKTGCQQRSV